MAQVFLSYKSEDRGLVAGLALALEREGLTVWWDRKIPAGGAWREAIAHEISASRVLIAVWSNRTQSTEGATWMLNELDEANRLRIPVIPVKVEACEPPFGYRHIQAADLIGWRGAASHLEWCEVLRAVRAAVAGESVVASTVARARRRPIGVPAALFLLSGLGLAAFALNRGPPDQAVSAAPIELTAEQESALGPDLAPATEGMEPISEAAPVEEAATQPIEEAAASGEGQSVDASDTEAIAYAGRGEVRGAFVRLGDGSWVERDNETVEVGAYHVNSARQGVIVLHDSERGLFVRIDIPERRIAVRAQGEEHYHNRYRIVTMEEGVDIK